MSNLMKTLTIGGSAYEVCDASAREQISRFAIDPSVYGLPVLYLTGDTAGMSKDNAVSMNYAYGERSGECTLKWQGSSSLSYPKKNYTIKFDNAFEAAKGWGEQKKYCLKANYIDHSHARNIVSAKLWGEIVKSRLADTPTGEELFDISKITGFINNDGDPIDWTTIANGAIRVRSFAYNSGSNYAVGQMYSKGDYTISFDAVNGTAATIEALIIGFGTNNKTCEVYQTVNSNLQTATHFEVTVSNTVENAYFFVVPSNASSSVDVRITNISITKSSENLFDFTKITGFINMDGVPIDWAYKNGDRIRVLSATAMSGPPFIIGQTYDEGEYTISFDAYNGITSDTNNVNSLVVGFGKVGANNCEKVIDFTVRGEWVHFEVSVINNLSEANLFLTGYSGVGNMKSDINFRNIKVYKEGGDSKINITNNLHNLVNSGAIDGFPVCIYINGQYTGLYTFNIPKDGWMFGMGSGTQECILCANNHSAATRFEAVALCDESDFEIEYITDETDTTWAVESVNRLISAVMNSDGTDIDSIVAKYLDIPSVIDFYIFTALQSGGDNVDKNYLLSTYDGVKWFFSTYDMDSTFGNHWTGKEYSSSKNTPTLLHFGNKVMHLVRDYKTDEVKARYSQLRSTVLSEDNVLLAFENFMAGIPSALYELDTKIWPLIPGTKTNNIAQIANFYRLRVQLLDAQIEQI